MPHEARARLREESLANPADDSRQRLVHRLRLAQSSSHNTNVPEGHTKENTIMDEGLSRKYDRLNALLQVGNVSAPHIQVEIEDLKRDLRLSGQTDIDIKAHTDSSRFEVGFDPTAKGTITNEEVR